MSIPHSRPNTDETAVQLNLPCHIVIQRLQQVQGTCSVTDSADEALCFYCNKNGYFTVDDYESYSVHRRHTVRRPYYVAGEVVEENGKTVVKFRTVHRGGSKVSLAVVLVSDLILFVLYFLLSRITKEAIILLVVIGVLSASTLLTFRKQATGSTADADLMKQEVLNRIEAVKRWEE